MSFEDELTAFRTYASLFPDNCLLLVDTYDTLTSGLPNALTVFKELRAGGHEVRPAIRLDSGDLARLSKAAYRMFTEAGFPDPVIVASNELDEDLIADLKRQGARVNSWGVGTHLITSSNHPALGGIYKLTAVHSGPSGDVWEPRIKLSSNPAKITNPGRKRLRRYRDADGRPLGDVMYLVEEDALPSGPRVPYVGHNDLSFVMQLEGVAACEELLIPMVHGGGRVAPAPKLTDVRARAAAEVASLPDELKRLRNPQTYPVGLSPLVARTKADLIQQAMGGFTWRNGGPAGKA